tara:strand:+ start:459 stop:707 length:249 start_codon:yes stop_codon:yes gene_type:complete
MKEPIVTIKFSHSEVKKLIESLIYLRDKEAELKKPYTQLLKDLKKIDEDIVEAKKARDEKMACDSFNETYTDNYKNCDVCED